MKVPDRLVAVTPNFQHKRSTTLTGGLTLEIVKDFALMISKIKEGSRDWENDEYNSSEELATENLRTKNAQEGVVYCDNASVGLKKGDTVIVQHFQFTNHSGEPADTLMMVNGEYIAFVPDYEVYYKIEDGKPVPVGDFLIAKEILKVVDSSIDLIGSEPEDVKVEIVAINNKNKLGLNIGDIVFVLERYCKYPIEFQGEGYVRIREEEVIGVITPKI